MPRKQLEHVAIPEIPFHELVLATTWQHHSEDPTKKAFVSFDALFTGNVFSLVARITPWHVKQVGLLPNFDEPWTLRS